MSERRKTPSLLTRDPDARPEDGWQPGQADTQLNKKDKQAQQAAVRRSSRLTAQNAHAPARPNAHTHTAQQRPSHLPSTSRAPINTQPARSQPARTRAPAPVAPACAPSVSSPAPTPHERSHHTEPHRRSSHTPTLITSTPQTHNAGDARTPTHSHAAPAAADAPLRGTTEARPAAMVAPAAAHAAATPPGPAETPSTAVPAAAHAATATAASAAPSSSAAPQPTSAAPSVGAMPSPNAATTAPPPAAHAARAAPRRASPAAPTAAPPDPSPTRPAAPPRSPPNAPTPVPPTTIPPCAPSAPSTQPTVPARTPPTRPRAPTFLTPPQQPTHGPPRSPNVFRLPPNSTHLYLQQLHPPQPHRDSPPNSSNTPTTTLTFSITARAAVTGPTYCTQSPDALRASFLAGLHQHAALTNLGPELLTAAHVSVHFHHFGKHAAQPWGMYFLLVQLPTHTASALQSSLLQPGVPGGVTMTSPDGGSFVLATLHDQPEPCSFSALSLLHFPIYSACPPLLRELLQQQPQATIFWVGRVAPHPQLGPSITDLCLQHPSSANAETPPLPPPQAVPLPDIAKLHGCAPGHGLALAARARPLTRRGMLPAVDPNPVEPTPLRTIPSELLPPRQHREEQQRKQQEDEDRARQYQASCAAAEAQRTAATKQLITHYRTEHQRLEQMLQQQAQQQAQ